MKSIIVLVGIIHIFIVENGSSLLQENCNEFFTRVCRSAVPPEAKFVILEKTPEYRWPEDKRSLMEIRESDGGSRCGEFIFVLNGFSFKVTAGVPRNVDMSLRLPNKRYPYTWKGAIKPLNYVFNPAIKDGAYVLNDLCVPSGGRTYNALIRGLVSSEEIRNFAANIKDILKGKNDVFDERSCEIAGIFLTSEYFRGKAAPIIGYAEFYKLKHDPTNERLSSVFKDKLLFAQAGGSVAIMNVKPNILQQSFLEMLEVPQEGIYALYRKMPASR